MDDENSSIAVKPAGPAEQGLWFVLHDGVSRGPYSSVQIRRLLQAETLSIDDRVSIDGEAWQPMSSVPEVVPPQLRGDSEDFEAALREERRGWRRQSLFGLALLLLVLVGVLAVTLELDKGGVSATDCEATPAPGVDWRDCRFSGLAAAGADLRGARLANAVLPQARLPAAVLTDGDLRYVDLSNADLNYAELGGALLLGADLRGADLTYADLRGADLSFADLRGAHLGGARLEGARLHGTVWVDGSTCPADAVTECASQ